MKNVSRWGGVDLKERVTNPIYPKVAIDALIEAEAALALAESGFTKQDNLRIVRAHETVKAAIQPLFKKQGELF